MDETKSKLVAADQEGQNKKELEEALSALSVEEEELKKKEEEFKIKEKVFFNLINVLYFFALYPIIILINIFN